MKYFVSHEALAIDKATKFRKLLKEINQEHELFITSDWHSLTAGGVWIADILNCLRTFDEMIVLITRKEAFENLWLNFEIGAAIGRDKKPKIFVWGGISMSDMKFPMKGIHCISTGDTNRYVDELGNLGYRITDHAPFADLFKQEKPSEDNEVEHGNTRSSSPK